MSPAPSHALVSRLEKSTYDLAATSGLVGPTVGILAGFSVGSLQATERRRRRAILQNVRFEQVPPRKDVEWLAPALATSGREQYRATLEAVVRKVSDDGRLRMVVRSALQDLDTYARLNPLVSAKAQTNPDKPLLVNRLVNIFRGDDWERMSDAAVAIEDLQIEDEYLFDSMQAVVLAHYRQPSLSAEQVKALGPMLRTLGESGWEKYLMTIKEVEENATNSILADVAGTILVRRLPEVSW